MINDISASVNDISSAFEHQFFTYPPDLNIHNNSTNEKIFMENVNYDASYEYGNEQSENNQKQNAIIWSNTENPVSLAKVALHQIEILNSILERRYQLEQENFNPSEKPSIGTLYDNYINNVTFFPEDRVPISSLPPSLRLDLRTKMTLYKSISQSYEQKNALVNNGFRVAEEICSFCKNNNEPEFIYKSHRLKTQGQITCPILRLYRCPICDATGDYAHTVKYCPQNFRGFVGQMY